MSLTGEDDISNGDSTNPPLDGGIVETSGGIDILGKESREVAAAADADAAATTGTTTFDAVDFKGVEEDILFEFISEEGMTVLDLGFFHPCYYKPNNPKRLVMMHFLLYIYTAKSNV